MNTAQVDQTEIRIVRHDPTGPGEIAVRNAAAVALAADGRPVYPEHKRWCFARGGSLRLTLSGACLAPGSDSAMVMLRLGDHAFSFFVRDVRAEYPIYLPQFGVAITAAADARSYQEIKATVESRRLQTALQRLASEEEESFDAAAAQTLNNPCPTWLGLSRDMRIFEIGFRGNAEAADYVQPRNAMIPQTLVETNEQPLRFTFAMGRGVSCQRKLTRSLEEGDLPILHASLEDGEIRYQVTAFTTLEESTLTASNVRGTHYLVATRLTVTERSHGHLRQQLEALMPSEFHNPPEETVLYYRIEATNCAAVPRYAWFKNIIPNVSEHRFNGQTGFAEFASGRIYAVSFLNGKPLPQEEIAVLLCPGEKAVFEFRLPHRPLSRERASSLAGNTFEQRHLECRAYWQEKLASAAQFCLPEERLNRMVRAGLLHLDLVIFGKEPTGTLAPLVGSYYPIGSESSPIVQFMDSVGWKDIAGRSLMYFLEKQREDGFIQTFGNYMLETGAVLWSIGEHYRYMHDDDWIAAVAPKILKACDYILAWRDRNRQPALKGKGYGLLDGKCADPEDPFHAFMLNGYAYLGLSRMSESLRNVNPAVAKRLGCEAEALRADIRQAFIESVARSPVIPLGDGTWCPTAPPWAEGTGPLCLFAERGSWFTHGSAMVRDSLLGPLHLVFQEVIAADEPAAGWLLNSHAELMCVRNVAFSQPYYSPHPWLHLKRGEVKAFLKAYYNSLAALADRETYTFWEHLFQATPHKTHEEAWFLMQTRWMLYMEEGQTLHLLSGIPRRWLESGKEIAVTGVLSYFGPVSFSVKSRLNDGVIEAEVRCDSTLRPEIIELRLPHPTGVKARRVVGGSYDAHSEAVRIAPFAGRARVVLEF